MTLTKENIQIGRVYRAKKPKIIGILDQLIDDRSVLHISTSKHPAKSGKGYLFTKEYLAWIEENKGNESKDSELSQMRYEDETKLSCIEWDYVVQYDSPSLNLGKHYPKISLSKFLKWASHDVTEELPKGEWAKGESLTENKIKS